MRHSSLLVALASVVGLLTGCQATAPSVPPIGQQTATIDAVSPSTAKPLAVSISASHVLPANSIASAKAMEKLLLEGAQYIVYSADPPVALELPRNPVQLKGEHASAVMDYTRKNRCIPLANSAEGDSAVTVTVCLEKGASVMRTINSLSYLAAVKAAEDPKTVPKPAPELLALPGNISGENDDGEGDEGSAGSRFSIIALPLGGDGLSGFRMAEYLVMPTPSAWLADTRLGAFAANSGCRLLKPFASPTEEFALCYLDDTLNLLSSADVEKLASDYTGQKAIAQEPQAEEEEDADEDESEDPSSALKK